MNKLQAKKKVFDYFKKNAIEYKFVNEELKLIDVKFVELPKMKKKFLHMIIIGTMV